MFFSPGVIYILPTCTRVGGFTLRQIIKAYGMTEVSNFESLPTGLLVT
jgi:hypothetical protein